MSLASLTLQAVLLIVVMLVATTTRLSMVRRMSSDVILVSLHFSLIHLIQDLNAKLDITQQLIASALAEILTNHNSQHLQIIRVGCHSVSGDNPASTSQLMSECEFIVVLLACLEAECDEGKSVAILLGHDDETELLKRVGQVVCGAGEVRHDRAVAVLA